MQEDEKLNARQLAARRRARTRRGRLWMAKIGRRGGSVRGGRKAKSSRVNAAVGRKKRLERLKKSMSGHLDAEGTYHNYAHLNHDSLFV